MLRAREDYLKHAIDILEHVIVPEPQYAVAAADEKLGAAFVGSILGMLSTIELDDKPEFVTSKVAEAPSDGRLPAEVMLLEWWLAQILPEDVLGICRVLTELTRTCDAVINSARLRVRHGFPVVQPE